jgi:signal transduction histidine kinase
MIFVWDNFQIVIILGFIGLNILILFTLEINNPALIPQYPTDIARISDSYGTLIIALGFFSIIIVSAKNNYIKQYKMAQRSDRLKSAFLANMSHEIRTPLNAIMGFTRLFTTRDLPKEKKEHYSQLITENSKYLMQLLSDILDISLIESGQLKTTFSTINLTNFFNKLYENLMYTLVEAGKSDVQLILNIPPDEKLIESDEIRLEQIMSNLINNAIKFTSQGYIKFGYYHQDNELVLFVEDTGIGIKEEFQPEIFNRFVKNEDNKDQNFVRGAGIGLSLTKELVQVLGGKIWFTSAYQEGSTFFLSLPNKSLFLQNNPH